jgi:hypothetical protein
MLKSYHVYSHDNMVIALDISQMREGARISVCSSSCRITKSRRGWLRRGGGDSSDERLQDKCRFRGRLRSKDHKPTKRCCHRNLNQLFLRVRRGSEVATQDEVWASGSGTISEGTARQHLKLRHEATEYTFPCDIVRKGCVLELLINYLDSILSMASRNSHTSGVFW